MEYEVEERLAEDRVAGRWTVTGTHEGEFEGIPPSGVSVEFPVPGTFLVEGRKAAEVRIVYDALGFMQQLGVVEQPTE